MILPYMSGVQTMSDKQLRDILFADNIVHCLTTQERKTLENEFTRRKL